MNPAHQFNPVHPRGWTFPMARWWATAAGGMENAVDSRVRVRRVGHEAYAEGLYLTGYWYEDHLGFSLGKVLEHCGHSVDSPLQSRSLWAHSARRGGMRP